MTQSVPSSGRSRNQRRGSGGIGMVLIKLYGGIEFFVASAESHGHVLPYRDCRVLKHHLAQLNKQELSKYPNELNLLCAFLRTVSGTLSSRHRTLNDCPAMTINTRRVGAARKFKEKRIGSMHAGFCARLTCDPRNYSFCQAPLRTANL